MVLYFAYGSNMLQERLEARIGTFSIYGIGFAHGFGLAFQKKGKDGSGKATLVADQSGATPSTATPGVLFEVTDVQMEKLHEFEGRGYDCLDAFPLVDTSGRTVEARTYIAAPHALDLECLPFTWYRALVIAGALQHALPEDHVDLLRALPARDDPDPDRLRENMDMLQRAGYGSCFQDKT